MDGSPRARAIVSAVCLAALGSLAGATAAGAMGTVTLADNEVEFVAGNGKANVLTVTTAPGTVTVTDAGDTLSLGTPARGCALTPDFMTVTCTDPTIAGYDLQLRDLDDRAAASGPLDGILRGGSEIDTLTGGNGDDRVVGGSEADVLAGGAGDDVLTDFDFDLMAPRPNFDVPGDVFSGGPGNDLLAYVPNDGQGDRLDGGPGVDTVGVDPLVKAFTTGTPQGAAVDLDAGTMTSGGQTDALASVENFEGLGGDTVLGSAAPNDYRQVNVFGTPDASDVVDLRSGPDVVNVGDGADRVNSDDGFRDQVLCGAGADTVTADNFDELTDCETVTRSKTPSADRETRFIVGVREPDRRAPVCGLTGPKSSITSTTFLSRRGVPVRLTCDEPITGRVQILTRVRRARGVTTAATGDLVLAEKTVSGSGARTVRLKPSRRLVRALGSRYRIRVLAEVRDAFGNRTAKAKRVTVKVPRRRRSAP